VLDRVPVLPNARAFAREGAVTGASHRNLASYGDAVLLASRLDPLERLLLSDPQTSGGLLVAVAPEAVDAVLARFRADGFHDAAAIGRFGDDLTTAPCVRVD
jgi:selenide,water dikinase